MEKFLLLPLPLEATTKRKKGNDLKPLNITTLLSPLFFLCSGLIGATIVFVGNVMFVNIFEIPYIIKLSQWII